MNCIYWLSGLSGAGKTTIAQGVVKKLTDEGLGFILLDGDLLRTTLNVDLGFSMEDRRTNLNRAASIAKLLLSQGIQSVCAFISPTESIRKEIGSQIGREHIREIFIKASFETCAKRDPKGLYKKVLNGELVNFTGYDSPFEIPLDPDLIIDTEVFTVEQSIEVLHRFIKENLAV